MLSGILSRILLILFLAFLGACSDGADEADPVNNPDVAPVTSITPDQEYISNQKDIVFTCKDSNVNDTCINTYYTWEDVPLTLEQEYLFRGKINAVGGNAEVVTVKYFSIDKAGNKEGVKTKSYIMDIDPPTLTPSVDPTQVYSQTQWVTFSCDNGGSGSPCKFIHYYTTTDGSANPEIIVPVESAEIQVNQNTSIFYRAEDEAGAIGAWQEISYTFSTQINNVNNLQVSAGDKVVNLSWNLPILAGSNVSDPNLVGYRILRKQGEPPKNILDSSAAEFIINDPNATSFSDTSVTNNNIYYYSIWAYDGAAPIANFSTGIVISALPAVDQAPVDVTGLNIIAGNGKVDMVWSNPASDFIYLEIRRDIVAPPASPTDGDLIYKGIGDDFSDVGSNLRTFTDTPLTNHIKYYYRIFAYDSAIQPSPGVGGDATPSDVLPGSVSNFKISAGEQFMSLSWVKPNDEDLAKITIVRNAGEKPFVDNNGVLVRGSVVTSCGNELALTNCIDSSAAQETQYYYGAYATDTGGNSNKPVIIGPYALVDIKPPGPVTQVTTTQGDGRILLKWVNPGDADFAETKILRSATSQPNINFPDALADVQIFSPGVSTSFLDEGLQNSIPYYYSFYTVDGSNNKSTQVSISLSTTAEGIAPELTGTDPVDGAIDVAPTVSITATFNEDILPSSVTNAPNGGMTLATSQEDLSHINISASVQQIDTNQIQLRLDSGTLPLATTLTASLSAEISDLSGNPLNLDPQIGLTNNTWSFTTADGSWGQSESIGVNQFGLQYDEPSKVAMDAEGNAMVVWRDLDPITDAYIIMAKLYSPVSGWKAPTIISSNIISAYDPSIVAGPNGSFLAVWRRGGLDYMNRYSPENGWESSATLLQNELSARPGGATGTSVVIDRNGMVTAAWVQNDGIDVNDYNLWARRFNINTPDVDWLAKPASLPQAELIEWNVFETFMGYPDLAVDGQGNVIAVWLEGVLPDPAAIANIDAVMYNRFDAASNSWDQPHDPTLPVHPHLPLSFLELTSEDATTKYNNSVGMDDAGNAIVVWTQSDNATGTRVSTIWAKHFDITNKEWSPVAKPISTNFTSGGTVPVIEMQPDGKALVLWQYYNLSSNVYANLYTHATDWQGDILFSATAGDTEPVFKFDPNGNAILVIDNDSKAQAHRYRHDSLWIEDVVSDVSNTTIIETAGTNSVGQVVDLAIAPDGTAVATWPKIIEDTERGSGYQNRVNIFKFRPTNP